MPNRMPTKKRASAKKPVREMKKLACAKITLRPKGKTRMQISSRAQGKTCAPKTRTQKNSFTQRKTRAQKIPSFYADTAFELQKLLMGHFAESPCIGNYITLTSIAAVV